MGTSYGLHLKCAASSWGITVKVGFHVLVAMSMKMAVYGVVAPCSLVEVQHCFRGACCQGDPLMMEAVTTSETSLNCYQTV
jgi:hypothetical protein